MLSVNPLASALADVFADYGDTAVYVTEPQSSDCTVQTQSNDCGSVAVSTPAVLAAAAPPADAHPRDLAVYNNLCARGCNPLDFTWVDGRITMLRLPEDTYGLTGTLDVSGCTALTVLRCDSNHLTALDVSGCTALTVLSCDSNHLTTLDLSTNTALAQLNCNYNQIIALDLSTNTALTELWCGRNYLTMLNLSQNTALTELVFDGNQLTTLDLSKNTALQKLWCNNNQLTTLDLSKNTALTSLGCSSNHLTTLDLLKNTALTSLNCSNNQLTTLDLSKNTALTSLSCASNQLTTLDLSKNTALAWRLDCSSNQLTTLDLSMNTALAWLDCSNNQLTALGLSRHTALESLKCSSNQLTFSTLKLPDSGPLTVRNYSPQAVIVIVPSLISNQTLNLSGEYLGGGTTYTWKYANGTVVAPSLYMNAGGIFTFAGLNVGDEIYCEMTNPKYVGMTLITTAVTINAEYTPSADRPVDVSVIGAAANAMALIWTGVDDAVQYEVQYSLNGGRTWTWWTGTTETTAAFIDCLIADTHYVFRVRAVMSGGVSEWSEALVSKTIPITDGADPAIKPKKVLVDKKINKPTTTTITLNMTAAASSDTASYVVSCISDPMLKFSYTVRGNQAAIEGLNPGTKYTFAVQAIRENGNVSAVVSVKASTAKYAAPNIRAVPNTAAPSSVTLSYKPSTAQIPNDYVVCYAIQVLLGKSPVTTLTSPDGLVWTDIMGTGLTVTNLGAGEIQIEGLALANTKYTFALKAVAMGPGGHVIQSLESKVSVKTAKL